MENDKRYDLPHPNEIEISLFGPGYGECALIHYGNGKWFSVDCCLERDKKTPAPLAYLEKIGVNPAADVSHVVLTHADGDHVGGISDLFFACEAARLVCPSILSNRDMLLYVAQFAQTDPTPLTRKTNELLKVLEYQSERPPHRPIFAIQDRHIIDVGGAQLTALSPADDKVGKFLDRIAYLTPEAKSDRRGPGKLRPNDVSLACIFKRGDFAAIFGADLEETPGKGWSTIIESSLAFRNAPPASAFKVAHHGSQNADSPELWATMKAPVAILAPFKHGRHKLPSPDDIARILKQTETAFSVTSFKTQPMRRLSRLDQVIRLHGIRRRNAFPRNGHIRLRVAEDNSLTTTLFGRAVHLSRVH